MHVVESLEDLHEIVSALLFVKNETFHRLKFVEEILAIDTFHDHISTVLSGFRIGLKVFDDVGVV